MHLVTPLLDEKFFYKKKHFLKNVVSHFNRLNVGIQKIKQKINAFKTTRLLKKTQPFEYKNPNKMCVKKNCHMEGKN